MLPLGFCCCYIKTAQMCNIEGKKGFKDDSSTSQTVCRISFFFYLNVFCRLSSGAYWHCPGPITWQRALIKTVELQWGSLRINLEDERGQQRQSQQGHRSHRPVHRHLLCCCSFLSVGTTSQKRINQINQKSSYQISAIKIQHLRGLKRHLNSVPYLLSAFEATGESPASGDSFCWGGSKSSFSRAPRVSSLRAEQTRTHTHTHTQTWCSFPFFGLSLHIQKRPNYFSQTGEILLLPEN